MSDTQGAYWRGCVVDMSMYVEIEVFEGIRLVDAMWPACDYDATGHGGLVILESFVTVIAFQGGQMTSISLVGVRSR